MVSEYIPVFHRIKRGCPDPSVGKHNKIKEKQTDKVSFRSDVQWSSKNY